MEHTLCATLLGEDLGSLHLLSLHFPPQASFPFADFALYSSAVINYSHEDSMLSPPSESSNLEGDSGTSQHIPLVASHRIKLGEANNPPSGNV